ncbi:mucin-2-like [Pungitius pungitius]|uniref:mucin-2-like n=1 Tax=Pungitius pungitius TaxID=134920 RepID=UPI002E164677
MGPEKTRIGPLIMILLLAGEMISAQSTTVAVNATEAPTAARNSTVNMTSPGVNMTSPAVNMTSPGVNMTSPGVNMTSPAVNMTSPAVTMASTNVNMTSPGVNMTSPAVNTTSPAVNMTSPGVNMTSPAVNITSPAVNMTSPAVTMASTNVNMTSPGVNMTSPAVTMASTNVNMTSPGVNMTSPADNMSTIFTRSPPGNVTSALVNGTSLKPDITTGSPVTTTAAPAPDSTIKLGFSLIQSFDSDLNNRASQKFKDLANTITTALDNIFRTKFGRRFLRSLIRSFRQGSVVVESELIFANASSVPEANDAQTTLVEAASNNSNFSLPVNVSTIVATVSTSVNATVAPTAAPNATVAPTAAPNATVAPTAAPNATVAPTAAPNATVAPTPAPTTTEAPASTDPPTSSEGSLRLLFSLSRAFTSDLSNRSSTAFRTLAAEVIKEVNRVAKNLYGPSFRRTIINSFTNGSVKVDSTLVFQDKSSVPEASNATSQFISALTNSSLGIVPGSISAQSTSTSSSPPVPTMGSLAVFSLTLLAVAQMLVDL